MIATFKLNFNFKSFNKLTIQFENMIWFQPIQPIGCISITDRYSYIYIKSSLFTFEIGYVCTQCT